MRKFCLPGTLAIALLFICNAGRTQDFSNRGKDFWIAYAGHIDGTSSVMGLYLTSDVNTSGSVQVGATNIPFTITANQVTKLFIGPNGGGNAPNLLVHNAQSDAINPGAGIHVTSLKNIVVYAHIIRSARSGATLVLPTSVLGKEYVIPSYENMSTQNGQPYGYGQITIVAVQPNTTVEIIPKANDLSGSHGIDVPFQVTLNNVGDVYQLRSQQSMDFSGSVVRSVSTAAGGCNPIAVFSSTTWSAFDCGPTSSGGDNLYQQLFPTKSWGKKFVTAPFINKPYDIIRIFVTDRTTVVTKTEAGAPTVLTGLTSGNYYEYKTNKPTVIEADKPVSVVQYITSQTCGGGNSDPEMIVINPVEQTLRNITLFSAHANSVPVGQTQVTSHYINVVIPTILKGTLRIDNAVPTAAFVDIPGAGFSYIQQDVTVSSATNPVHTIKADTGFTAIVYGYGNVESYGYNAGANFKDNNQFVTVSNQYATVDFPAACKGAPFNLAMTFPYKPTSIKWEFNGLYPDVTLTGPTYSFSSVVNGVTLYKYVLAGSYTAPATAGIYPIRIIAQNPTPDGCDGIQEIEYDLEVFEPPVADFNFATNGCVSSPVTFTDNSSNPSGRAIAHRHWNFGDASFVNNVANTSHTYAAAGSYTVKYTLITDVGCKSTDSASKVVVLNDPPVAGFAPAAPYCAGKIVTFNESSTGTNIIKWIWDFGDGSPQIMLAGGAQTHTYAAPGPYTVKLQVETASGCLSTVFTQNITVHPNPVVDFSLPVVCLPAGTAQFNSLSTIADGSEAAFIYSWNFGDASAPGTGASPVHNYAAAGPYNVALTVTSNNGCITTGTKALSTIYPEPVASFTAPAEVCINALANFNSAASTAPGSSVTAWEWNFGDMATMNTANPSHTYTGANTYTVTLAVTSAVGCKSVSPANTGTKTIVVNPLPTADFTIGLPGCVTKSVSFTNASVPNAGNIIKWTWNFGDGSPNVVATTGASVSHTYNTINGFPATLQVETDKGCVSTVTTKNVMINALPSAAFAPPVICVNDAAAPFEDNSTITSGTITGWQWNFGDANATAANPNTSAAQDATHHYTLPGNYTAQLIAISNAGCRDTTEHTFTVNGAVLTPSFVVQNAGPGALCSNKNITIKDASQIDAGKIIRTEIFWDINDLSIKTTDNDPQAGELYSHAYPEFGAPATRTVTVRFDVYSGLTCVNSFRQDITLLATPMLASEAAAPICSNADPFQLAVQLLNQNVVTGNGSFTGPGVTAAGMFTPGTAGAGTHSIVYTYNANNGCSNSVTKTMIVDPTPVADAGSPKVVLEGGSVQLTPVIISNIPVTYSWSPATWLSNAGIPKPDASPPTDFTYTLTVTSDKGCFTSDNVFVKLLKAPVIPNIFSPNGDGINDRWVIEYLESYPGCVVQIYNRYGQMIHRVVNYITPWDGRISGKDAPVGTYYYIIDPKNGRKPMTGYVDIIR